MDTRYAPVFLSHGSPMTALDAGPAGAFWRALGRAIDARVAAGGAAPSAIVALSAHTLARRAVTLAGARHEAVHDFGGFPQALYDLRYDVAGVPCLAPHVEQLLQWAAIEVEHADAGGLDHGIWVPLRDIRPRADIPVLPLAFPPDRTPEQLFELGAALSPLIDEGVWIVGTGSITHNLRLGLPRAGDVPELPASAAFRAWFADRSAARDWRALWQYRTLAPEASFMHPTDEHLLPWFIAAGAGGAEDVPIRLHASVAGGHLGMDAYAFGADARALADDVEAAAAM
ncbi:DODA-type extradiol aromatic ring-opening family dioxygenase [Scleromatobacter humisilvae]|uniref:Dioxygenase n=1 Tax=Scleromatobacter humisilvae TaxID=2897159 RepID=A0A9X2C197_9BURK|nr:class III extradiol ring-cleavage dioxygenase [Scleromatobacter humisilvae]MCK9684740.1 dioxygenase [Scleromatobacter humisilvae]